MQNGALRGPREDVLPNAIEEDVGRTALHEAATAGDEKTLQVLLAAGADRNAKDSKHGNTPLHEAAWRGYSRCVKALCVLPQQKTSSKNTKETKIKGALQETRGALHSALLGTRNSGGFSPLHLAAQNGHNQSCREILLAGADPDVQNNYGDTPLHTACRYGHAGATRILLSGKCDPNRTNLNGDTPLHISCAMGRRKLTRILLEAGASIEMKNLQHETPREIACRKSLPEILEILDNFVKEKISSKERVKGSSSNKKSGDKVDGPTGKQKIKKQDEDNPINWSPYGCHYFPDPRSFPSPKLETLPKEPLGKGEQYYLDLAGNIRKGPVGVANTCYCGPFFRHIEERISRNRKSLRKYVNKATEKIDSKVQALALRTDDQIEQLTRSMMADRLRCEGQKLYLEQWLKRGSQFRSTSGHHSKSKKNMDNANTLTRCRSLELLDVEQNIEEKKMQNSKSFDMLDESDPVNHLHDTTLCSSLLSSDKKPSRNSDRSKSSCDRQLKMKHDDNSVTRRLEELLSKTNEILEMENLVRRRRKEHDSSIRHKGRSHEARKNCISLCTEDVLDKSSYCNSSLLHHQYIPKDVEFIAQEMEKITTSLSSQLKSKEMTGLPIQHDDIHASPEITKDFTSQKEFERRSDQEHERSSIISSGSQRNPSSTGSGGYIPDFSGLRVRKSKKHSVDFSKASGYSKVHEVQIHNQNAPTESQASFEGNQAKNTTDLKVNQISNEHSVHPLPLNEVVQQTVRFIDDVDGELSEKYKHLYYNDNNISKLEQNHSTFDNNNAQERVGQTEGKNSLENRYSSEQEECTEISEMANIKEINELKSRILNGSNWKSQVFKKTQQMQNRHENENPNRNPNGHIEVKNGEIKSLKISCGGILKRNKVQELVARIQGKSTHKERTDELSESSEDEEGDRIQYDSSLNNNNNNNSPHKLELSAINSGQVDEVDSSNYYYNRAQPQVASPTHQPSYSPNYIKILDTKSLIPKDAYFHELPHKKRNSRSLETTNEEVLLNSNYTDQYYQNATSLAARNRNPFPYIINDELISTDKNDISDQVNTKEGLNYNSNYSKPVINVDHIHTSPNLSLPIVQKDLYTESFLHNTISTSMLSNIHKMEYHQQQQQRPEILNDQNQKIQSFAVSISPEQAQIDREMNNDSGYGTKPGGSSYGPSPSLSGHTELGVLINNGNFLETENNKLANNIRRNNNNNKEVTYFIENIGASSLV